jgi:excisionase family DNA binding protein
VDDLDILTLAEAAELLGRSPTTLRSQVAAGRLRARLVGKTWVTHRAEVERYRRDSIGKVGRPVEAGQPGIVAEVAWPDNAASERNLRILGFGDTPGDAIDAVVEAASEAILRGAWTVAEVVAALRADPRTRHFVIVPGGASSVGLGRDPEAGGVAMRD